MFILLEIIEHLALHTIVVPQDIRMGGAGGRRAGGGRGHC